MTSKAPQTTTLDELIDDFGHAVMNGAARNGKDAREFKQAIIDAIERARPAKKSEDDYGSWEEGHQNVGYNKAIDQYEQNLMKEFGL